MKHAQIDPQMCTHVNKLIHQFKAYFQHVALRMNLSIVGDHFETIFFQYLCYLKASSFVGTDECNRTDLSFHHIIASYAYVRGKRHDSSSLTN